ncbi:MAG: hypothetical protein RJB42_831 [Bacteroidota bacterium]|jgi:hypothetical protein
MVTGAKKESKRIQTKTKSQDQQSVSSVIDQLKYDFDIYQLDLNLLIPLFVFQRPKTSPKTGAEMVRESRARAKQKQDQDHQ